FARVRIRRQLLPLMQTYNRKFVEALARTTEILREDNQALDIAAAALLESWLDGSDLKTSTGSSLRISAIQKSLPSLRRRALRLWLATARGDLRKLEYAHIRSIENLLTSTKSGREVELPGGSRVLRSAGRLHYLEPKGTRRS